VCNTTKGYTKESRNKISSYLIVLIKWITLCGLAVGTMEKGKDGEAKIHNLGPM
jgi:hypothetical protein